jgi:hypothetical protein
MTYKQDIEYFETVKCLTAIAGLTSLRSYYKEGGALSEEEKTEWLEMLIKVKQLSAHFCNKNIHDREMRIENHG